MSYLEQSELYRLGKDGVKVPIDGYKFGKDGLIVPEDNDSYNVGKDGVIIPKPGYMIGKNGIIIKKEGNRSFGGVATPATLVLPKTFDFTKSNLVLMIGGQILVLVILLMVVFFGTEPLTFPANAVRNMIAKNSRRNNSK
jgi:hypothetical protein